MLQSLSRSVGRRERFVSQFFHRPQAPARVPVVLIVFLAVFSTPVVSSAAELLYGQLMGTEVTFIDVKESSASPLPLYGAPSTVIGPPGGIFPCLPANGCTVSGNSLHFSPQLFDSESNNQVPPNETTDGQLTFLTTSKPGQAIQNINFQEAGAFAISGFVASNTNDTFVEATGAGNVTVLEIDGNSNIVPLVIPINLAIVYDPNVGPNVAANRWRFLSEGSAAGSWSGTQLIDIKQALIDAGRPVNAGATKISVNFDNILVAQSEPLGAARIDKKLFLTVTINVPEPASCGLAFMAVAFCACLGRRGRV